MPLPKLPKLGGFPKPPRIAEIIRRANPIRDVVDDAREVIKGAREEVSEVASSLRVEGAAPPAIEEPKAVSMEEGAKEGTACIVCSDEHFSETSGALSEAIRFARDKGVGDREVTRRVRHAREELNAMERFDLSPQQVASLPEDEKPVGRWAVSKSRELRHALNSISSVDDLEKVAAQASDVADEFEQKTMELKKRYEGEIETNVVDLRKWLEGRKKKESGNRG